MDREYYKIVRQLLILVVFMASTPSLAQTVKEYFVRNNKVPQGTMTATPMIGTYGSSGIEIGGKISFEPFPKGFVEPINDSVSFEAGAFRGQSEHHTRTLVTVSMRWDFNLIPLWTVYGAPGISLRNERRDDHLERGHPSTDGPEGRVALCLGGLLNVGQRQALRLEFDYVEATMRAGYMFRF